MLEDSLRDIIDYLIQRLGGIDNLESRVGGAEGDVCGAGPFQGFLGDFLFAGEQDVRLRIEEDDEIGLWHQTARKSRKPHRSAVAIAARVDQ